MDIARKGALRRQEITWDFFAGLTLPFCQEVSLWPAHAGLAGLSARVRNLLNTARYDASTHMCGVRAV